MGFQFVIRHSSFSHSATVSVPATLPNLEELIGLFYADVKDVGSFKQVPAGMMPGYARTLLSHNEHMTVTVEEFHGCSIDVDVLQVIEQDTHYSRKIVLRRQSDQRVVLFGIVRLDFRHVDDDVRREIVSRQIPLGKILIEHNVLRQLQLVGLWKVDPGSDLRKTFDMDPTSPLSVYGRTALIYCDGEPAVELLEIISPV
jgi:chorismate-pyruvate lyase